MSTLKSLALSAPLVLFFSIGMRAQSLTIEGAPTDSGFNVGTPAGLRVTLKGAGSDLARYAVFAEIQFIGTTATTNFQLDQQGDPDNGVVHYEGGWPIPADAPAGVYSVRVKVEDRKKRQVVAEKELRGFAAYRKLVSITGVWLDKTFYTVGEPIQCAVMIRNLTDQAIHGLQVEFSNANYPWISTFSGEANSSSKPNENPQLGLKVMSEKLDLAPLGEATIPMMPAGTAQFLQGKMVALLGAGGPARNAKEPPPEVDQYTVAVWNSDRTILYDMQFSKPAIVRPASTTLPKPYSNLAYTHPYNSDIDYKKYREFYAPGETSSAIALDRSQTMFRPGDALMVKATVRNDGPQAWEGVQLRAKVSDASGKQLNETALASGLNLLPGETKPVDAEAWKIPPTQAAGTYSLKLALARADGALEGHLVTDFAVNTLPASIMVIAPHEDDEHFYAGLIRAAVEVGVPVHVVILTGGDVGECERYYFKPCGPNEAREFAEVRMEESAEALEHLGLSRGNLSFLGLPDGGSGEIWFHHIKPGNPYLSVYLASDHAPYPNVVKPNLLYSREAVIAELERLIADFHPALIATAHPDERHVDHRTTSWFVLKACQELLRRNQISPGTMVLADQAYGAGGFKPAPYQYEPAPVQLSGEAATLKQEMSWIYQSQDGNLHEGTRKSFDELLRQEMHFRIVGWQDHEGWNESVGQ
ncbi:MAG: PIG-L family deacetylase [Deltaproteobacteria bacterium]